MGELHFKLSLSSPCHFLINIYNNKSKVTVLITNNNCLHLKDVHMSISGYIDYQRREFCKDIKCSIQLDLDAQQEGSQEYEKIRRICKESCKYTTYQFHHWLIQKRYLIIRSENQK